MKRYQHFLASLYGNQMFDHCITIKHYMGWTILLEDEMGESIIPTISKYEMPDSIHRKNTRLLCYLDPYGDTVFNYLQMDDIIQDIEFLQSKGDNFYWDSVKILADHCKMTPHTYLVFYGN